jgi:hypothetical protein
MEIYKASERYSGKRNAKISFTNKYYNNDAIKNYAARPM